MDILFFADGLDLFDLGDLGAVPNAGATGAISGNRFVGVTLNGIAAEVQET